MRQRRQEPAQRNYHEHSFTVADLDPAAAQRQATIGKHYNQRNKTSARLNDLKQGTITLLPHGPWTGDYTDWSADPFDDLNWRFQFHTLRWINPYLWDALEGDDESKAEWKRIVQSWTKANIPPEQAADKYAWMDMTDGNRAIQTSIGAPLIDDDEQWYVDCLATHRNWLLDDANIVPGNHGLHQNLGLFVVSSVLSDAVGVQRAIERMASQILDAFDHEGLNEEGSVAYHQYNLVWWLEAQKRLNLEGYDFPKEAQNRLEKAGEAMAHLLLPDATMPQIGDGGRGKGQTGIHPLLDQVIKGKVEDPSLPLFRHFSNGFTVFRSGWGQERPLKQESHTIVRHGIDLERHSHDDRGSVHIYTMGRRWITDGGFHSYQHHSRDRNYTKSRSAHSLVHLPEQKHDISGDVPAQLIQHGDELHAIEICDENFEDAQWLRRVIYLPKWDCWIIWDRIRTDLPQRIRQQWLIDLEIDVLKSDARSLRLTSDDGHLRMRWYGDQPALDIARGNQKAKSKRGLIGIRWKQMKNGTSIHANFYGNQADSIVVITPVIDNELEIDLSARVEMSSFTLLIQTQEGNYDLEANLAGTRLTRSD